MEAGSIILLLLITLWIVVIILQLVNVQVMRRPRQTRPPPPPERPPPLRRRRRQEPPREPEIPPPPIQIESLTLIVKEPSRVRLATKIEPEADSLWPAAGLTVNDRNLAGRILPLTFKIANPLGEIVYESSLDYTLSIGFNTVSTTGYAFRVRGRNDIREGELWEIQLFTGAKMLVRAQFKISEDVVKKLKTAKLSKADGELSRPAQDMIEKLEAPDLEDLIDNK